MINHDLIFSTRKDFEMSEMSTRIEDEQALVNQLQKKIKELQVEISLLTSYRAVLNNHFEKVTDHCFPPGSYRGAGGGAGGRPGLQGQSGEAAWRRGS